MRNLRSHSVRVLLVAVAAVAAALVPAAADAAPPYANCSAVWQQLGRPIFPDDAGYNFQLDADRDGVGCETNPGVTPKTPPAVRRNALKSTTYNHLGVPARGQARSDTWIQETFTSWDNPVRVQGVSRAAKVSKAARTQVSVTRLEDQNGMVWARNAIAVNSGAAAAATQTTPAVAVHRGACAKLRLRSTISIRWTDGALSTVSVLGPFTTATWCRA
jgi:hypothetical protein